MLANKDLVTRYEKIMEEFLKKRLGAEKVVIFDYEVRETEIVCCVGETMF
jgi:hypothetical protein